VWEKTRLVDNLSTIVSSQGIYHFTPFAMKRNPQITQNSGNGTGTKITSRVFAALPSIDSDTSDDVVTLIGLSHARRVSKLFRVEDIEENKYLRQWKVFVPEANGSGNFGEVPNTPVIGMPVVAPPMTGSTDTFINVGPVSTKSEAEHLLSYIKTKFARALLGILKVTQHNPRSTWRLVPLQDFTNSSDIDWNVSIPEIDDQLYHKYSLDQKEIDFIEQNVQEMK
jgi:hypothetical protein